MVRVAREHIYELDEEGQPYRLLIPAGGEVSDDTMKRLGIKKSQVEEAKDSSDAPSPPSRAPPERLGAMRVGKEPRRSGETLLHNLAEERHTRVLAGTPTSLPRDTAAPPGFRAEDYLGIPELDGYVTLPEAAERMGVSEEEIVDMARRFLLTYRTVGTRTYIRPAILGEG
jgi:hypothetical protein